MWGFPPQPGLRFAPLDAFARRPTSRLRGHSHLRLSPIYSVGGLPQDVIASATWRATRGAYISNVVKLLQPFWSPLRRVIAYYFDRDYCYGMSVIVPVSVSMLSAQTKTLLNPKPTSVSSSK